MTRFAVEGLANGSWAREHVGAVDETTLFSSQEEAAEALEGLVSNGFGPREGLRVVEVVS